MFEAECHNYLGHNYTTGPMFEAEWDLIIACECLYMVGARWYCTKHCTFVDGHLKRMLFVLFVDFHFGYKLGLLRPSSIFSRT